MSNISNLIIGQGIGPARFGMTEEEITNLFGKPDEREVENYDDMVALTLYYDKILTDFTFDLFEDEDGKEIYRLTSIMCSNPQFTLDNKIHYGDSEEVLLKYTKSLKADDPELLPDSEFGENILIFNDLGFIAAFNNNQLKSVQIQYWDEEPEE